MAISDITNQHNDGSARSDAAQKRARDDIDLREDASPEPGQVALTAPSDDAEELSRKFICPIDYELPIHPVTAEDGMVYERAAIERWFETREGDPTSPMTNAVIGTELIPAPQIRNKIEELVKSGAIDGELAEEWLEKLDQEKIVMKEMKDLRAKADGGDGEAMLRIGKIYELGINGLAKDKVQARAWYERSAAARNPRGMVNFGKCLLFGRGGPKDTALGLDMVRQAAALGSDVAAYILGNTFFHGMYNLPKDPVRARPWLEKVVRGRFYFRGGRARAAEMLRELDQEE